MTPARLAGRAITWSSFDVTGAQEPLLYGCEDCACAVSSERRHAQREDLPDIADARPWVRGAGLVEMPLDAERRLLFNPAGRGGVLAVNEPAYRIFQSFARAVSLAGARAASPGDSGEFQHVVTRLSQADLIHPGGQPPAPGFGRSRMLTAWLHVSNACNLRCPYCYVSKSAEGMDEPTGRAAVEAVIRSAVSHGFPAVKLKYAGGEASLNRRVMMHMHGHARALAARSGLGLYATLLSNGTALTPGLITALKAEGIRVMISLDGVGARHDVQRPTIAGKPSFHLVERGIARLLEQGHPPHLSITITSRNAVGLAEAVRFALERDLTFSLNFFRDNDCAASFPGLRYEEQAMISALLEAFGVVEEYLPRWSVLGSVLDRGQLLEPRQRPCGVGQDYLVIGQRGQVAKCHMEIERTLGDVWSDDPLMLVRQDTSAVLNLAVGEKEGCRDCAWRYWCSGGCSVATFRATGRYDIKSPNCNIYKAIYPEALRLEGLRLLRYAAAGAPAVTQRGGAARSG